jgi:hypothetical protein
VRARSHREPRLRLAHPFGCGYGDEKGVPLEPEAAWG